jgi:hypothetical protein
MSAKLYTIAFKPSDSVLAACTLEDRKLADDVARKAVAFRDLVGDELPITLAGNPIKVPATDLVLDELDLGADGKAALGEPYGYQVNRAGAPALLHVTGITASNIQLKANVRKVLVTLPAVAVIAETVWLLLEGAGTLTGTTVINSATIEFGFTQPISVGDRRGLVFLRKGLPAAVRTLEAT